MFIRKTLLASAAALCVAAVPALAQSSSTSTTSGSNGNGSPVSSSTTSLDAVLNLTNNSQHNTTQTNNSQHNPVTNTSLTNNSQRNGNWRLAAVQDLSATITNQAPMNFNGPSANYSSGAQSINGSAFASYAGILNQGWNTGVNANAQAATNIAAQGTVTF